MIAAPTSISWGPERFYWAVLHAPAFKSRTGRAFPLPPGLLAELADQVPQAIEEIWAVGAPMGDDRVLVCAAQRAELAEVEVSACSLTPRSLPPGVDEMQAALLPTLNLLVGEFEPVAVRRARWRRHRGRAGLLVLMAGLVSIGLVRRADHWSQVARAAEDAQVQIAADLLGPGVPLTEVNYALAAEVDRMRELARARPPVPNDASLQLASLLRSWPAATPSKPQSVSVSEAGVTVSVSVEGDPAPFLSAFRPPEGWTLDEPRLNQAGEVTRLTLHLRPVASAAGAVP